MRLILFLGVLGMGAMTVNLRNRLQELDASWTWKRLLAWAAKGIIVPLIFLLAFLSGLGGVSPPVISYLASSTGTSWFSVFMGVCAVGFYVTGSYWAAITFAWFYSQIIPRVPAEERSQFWATCAIWLVLGSPIWIGLIWGFGLAGAGLGAACGLALILYGAFPFAEIAKRTPIYARAIGLIKMGKFSEAELEVIRQLEIDEEDFSGWMMLAELYAVHFQDLGAAEETVAQLIQQKTLTHPQVASALHQLAEWQIKIGQDPAGARVTLEEICRRFPGTNLDRMAERRLQQLPRSREELLLQQKTRAVRLPAGVDPFAPRDPAANREEALAEVNRLSERLQQDPNDIEVRETFAWLLAESLGKVDLAFEQIGLLMEMPELAEGKMARWLAMSAAWELRHRQDRAAARVLMQRLVHDYPESAEAFAAQRRLNLMDMEERLSTLRHGPSSVHKGID